MSQQLDPLDTIATKAFEGYVVRKDLVRKFKGQYPVPTYVAEFLLGRYCSSIDDEEITEGLKIVERQLGEKTVRAGEHELFKARAKDKGQVKLIDIITARLDAGTDSFLATLPSLQLKDVRINEAMVHANERMLTRMTRPSPRRRMAVLSVLIDARDSTIEARSAAGAISRQGAVCHRGVEGFPDSEYRHGA
jgi:ATP-dependent Lon protease